MYITDSPAECERVSDLIYEAFVDPTLELSSIQCIYTSAPVASIVPIPRPENKKAPPKGRGQ